jgi:stage V sporulation protein B
MQASGYAHIPVVNMLLCGIVKLAVVYTLVGNPNLGIVGAPIGAAVGYLCIGMLNIFAINRTIKEKPSLVKNLLRPVLPAALMGAAVFGVYQGLLALLGEGVSSVILCGVPIVVGVGVYFAGVVLFKTITKDDCLLLPKGEKIAKLLRL